MVDPEGRVRQGTPPLILVERTFENLKDGLATIGIAPDTSNRYLFVTSELTFELINIYLRTSTGKSMDFATGLILIHKKI